MPSNTLSFVNQTAVGSATAAARDAIETYRVATQRMIQLTSAMLTASGASAK